MARWLPAAAIAAVAGACEDGAAPTVGRIEGRVGVENVGLSGVSVTLSGGAVVTTDSNGRFVLRHVETGQHTITISGYPADSRFDAIVVEATITSAGQTVVANFNGTWIRTAGIMGKVTVEGDGLSGIAVAVSGYDELQTRTDSDGSYAFTGMRRGDYIIEVSGFDSTAVEFGSTADTISLHLGVTAVSDFFGSYFCVHHIAGRVTVEGIGISDVTVTLDGLDSRLATTAVDGGFSFADLCAGRYEVTIGGYDTSEYGFETTTAVVDLASASGGNRWTTVLFAGVPLTTAGIFGRVGVENEDLADVTVTLSGMGQEGMTKTDATGQYGFVGLAAGDYTVTISDYDSGRYAFHRIYVDVTLSRDEAHIASFAGVHVRTASAQGVVYVDELARNDSFDEEESGFGVSGVVLALIGPGIHDRRTVVSASDGSFVFDSIPAGAYQLVVADGEASSLDLDYGGPPEGYLVEVAAGGVGVVNVPYDITHQRIVFAVNLRHGKRVGAALPGAVVTVYRDRAAQRQIGTGITDEHGRTSIRIARSAASDSTVYVRVAHPSDSYRGSNMTQAVTWDPRVASTLVSNAHDIVNVQVVFFFRGTTVTTDFGGGDPLAFWAASVTPGDQADLGTPMILDHGGTAYFSELVSSVMELPKTYRIDVASDQDDRLDGGEEYTMTQLQYSHDGLRLPGKQDAGTVEIAYTTQTLRVAVHNERDLIVGYTGNILSGDVRSSGILDIGVRHIDRISGRARRFPTSANVRGSSRDGVYTFRNVPADAQVIVSAAVKSGKNAKLIGATELDAYTDNYGNGRTGGAFGDHGGYSHTVELCPLVSSDTDQLHGQCGTFAFVYTYRVRGRVWGRTVNFGAEGDFIMAIDSSAAGVFFGLDPVRDAIRGGVSHTYSADANADATRANANSFDWEAGAVAYEVVVSPQWEARGVGDATTDLSDLLNPLSGDLQIEITPKTGYVYGVVTDQNAFQVAGATVRIGLLTATTDVFGRYRIPGIDVGGTTTRRVEVVLDGYEDAEATVRVNANVLTRRDVTLASLGNTATVSGRVLSEGRGVVGVEIKTNGNPPRSAKGGKLLTGGNGRYTALVNVGIGEVVITAGKKGYVIVPDSVVVPVTDGMTVSSVDFSAFEYGTITGRVLDDNGRVLRGATVVATPANGPPVVRGVTNVHGVFRLSVPPLGSYTVTIAALGYRFGPGVFVYVGPSEKVSLEDFEATGSVMPVNVVVTRDTETGKPDTYAATATTTWNVGTAGKSKSYQVQTGRAGEVWIQSGARVDSTSIAEGIGTRRISAGDGAFEVRVLAIDGESDEDTVPSAVARVAAISPVPTNVDVRRIVTTGRADMLLGTWEAKGNDRSDWRLAVSFDDGVNWFLPNAVEESKQLIVSFENGFENMPNVDPAKASTHKNPTLQELEGAFLVRVDYRQGSLPWQPGAATAVNAK